MAVDSPSRLVVGFPEVHWCSAGHRGGGCRCSSGCCGNCGCRCVDHFGGFSDHTDRPDHRRNGHSHRSGRRGSGLGGHLDGNRRLGVVGPGIVGGRYRCPDRNCAHLAANTCSGARSVGLVRP